MRRRRNWSRIPVAILTVLLLVLLGAAGFVWARLEFSKPRLEGRVEFKGLTAPVTVVRDADGVPTIRGRDRLDLARAVGYLHGQERFFQMDTLRRSAAGEVAALAGKTALALDRKRRPHRFRARAEARYASMEPMERTMLEAYTDGVNQGLADLGAAPFEYLVLRSKPAPWTPVDSMLAVVAMYFELQSADGEDELRLAAHRARMGVPLADFLYPVGTDWDAPLDDRSLPLPPLPTPDQMPKRTAAGLPALLDEVQYGSNNWAVGGALTAHGGGMVAGDMHLGLGVPNTWYRLRLVLEGADGAPVMDLSGVGLPGTPNVVAGSNGKVAWSFTNSYIDTSDVILLEPAGNGGDGWSAYRTPDGPEAFRTITERICAADGTCEDLTVQETRWGPVIVTGKDGARYAYRWTAHDMGGRLMMPFLELETAGDVDAAIAAMRTTGIPQQNLAVADKAGNVAWTVAGLVPRRVGLGDGRAPQPWSDGRGWTGWLSADEVPTVRNPADGRIWTANGRIVGGDAFALLGDGGYAHGARTAQIRDALRAKARFAEADMLAIQLDDRSTLLDRWQPVMLTALEARAASDPKLAAMLGPVRDWNLRAVPGNVGYRLVRAFRANVIGLTYGAYLGLERTDQSVGRLASRQAEGPIWRLLSDRPAHMVPPGFADWDAVLAAALDAVKADVDKEAQGNLAAYDWGARNMAAIRHPLSPFVPLLGRLTDAPVEPLPGDSYQPRAQGPRFGASQRLVVAPGREDQGYFHMPSGQSGHPLSPYYLAGHDAWVHGRPTPFLPGPAKWTLSFVPIAK